MIGELTARTEPGETLVRLAEQASADIATRAAEYDRDHRYVAENMAGLRSAGLLGATVPRRWGGLGVDSVHDLAVAVSRLARGCPSTALAATMHLGAAWAFARAPQPLEPAVTALLMLMGRGRMTVAHAATEQGGTLAAPRTTARPVDGGFRLDGRKTMVTNAEVADLFLVFLRVVTADGEHTGTAAVRRGTPGLEVRHTWDALGMRGTGSHTVELTGCVVPADAVRIGPPLGRPAPELWAGLLGINLPLTGAYLGIAEAAQDLARRSVRAGRSRVTGAAALDDPAVHARLAETEVGLSAARAVISRAADAADEALRSSAAGAPGRTTELMYLFQAAKLTVNRACVEAVDRAMTIVGGSAYGNGHPLSRLYRDCRAGGFMQPYAPAEAAAFLGRAGLDLDPFATTVPTPDPSMHDFPVTDRADSFST